MELRGTIPTRASRISVQLTGLFGVLGLRHFAVYGPGTTIGDDWNRYCGKSSRNARTGQI